MFKHYPWAALWAAALTLLAAPEAAYPQSYPAKPIRIVSQFVAGSSGDTLVRIVTEPLSPMIGQPFVIDNRAGAGGLLAAQTVARAAPDGYTLLSATTGVQISRIYLVKNNTFDVQRDLTSIIGIGDTPLVLVANPKVPADSLKALLEYAKANPGKLSYGTSGVGSSAHLTGEQIRMLTRAELVHIPYKAGAQTLTDLMAGELSTAYVTLGGVLPHIRSGKLKALALATTGRAPELPEVSSIEETVPGFEPLTTWTALFGPAGLPAALTQRLNAEVLKAMSMPATRARMDEAGFTPVGSSPEEFAATIRRQIDLVGRIVKSAGIQPTD